MQLKSALTWFEFLLLSLLLNQFFSVQHWLDRKRESENKRDGNVPGPSLRSCRKVSGYRTVDARKLFHIHRETERKKKKKWKIDWNVDRRGQRNDRGQLLPWMRHRGSSLLACWKIVKTTLGASDVTFETQLGVIQLINYHGMKDDSRDSTACCVTQHVGKRVSKAVIIEQKLRVVRDFECVHVKEIRCTVRERESMCSSHRLRVDKFVLIIANEGDKYRLTFGMLSLNDSIFISALLPGRQISVHSKREKVTGRGRERDRLAVPVVFFVGCIINNNGSKYSLNPSDKSKWIIVASVFLSSYRQSKQTTHHGFLLLHLLAFFFVSFSFVEFFSPTRASVYQCMQTHTHTRMRQLQQQTRK